MKKYAKIKQLLSKLGLIIFFLFYFFPLLLARDTLFIESGKHLRQQITITNGYSVEVVSSDLLDTGTFFEKETYLTTDIYTDSLFTIVFKNTKSKGKNYCYTFYLNERFLNKELTALIPKKNDDYQKASVTKKAKYTFGSGSLYFKITYKN